MGDKHAELKGMIRDAFGRHKGRYGYRRVTETICQEGAKACPNTVQRLMVDMGLKSLVRPKKYRSFKGEVGAAAPNILDRNFHAGTPDEKWVTDVTEFNVGGDKLFLSTVMDLCTGEIVAQEMDSRPSLSMVIEMLKKALDTLSADAQPMVHSDQGWQYRMNRYQDMLAERGLVQSMSRKGNCHDNAAMESFFAVLKSEYFHLNKFVSADELRNGLAGYIDYYNHSRIKMKLGGLSPKQYRAQFAMARH